MPMYACWVKTGLSPDIGFQRFLVAIPSTAQILSKQVTLCRPFFKHGPNPAIARCRELGHNQ